MYILFIVSYLVWVVLSGIVIKRASARIIEGKSFWFTQGVIFIQVVFFFLFIYLVTGFFSVKLAALFLIGSELGVLIHAIIIGFVGSIRSNWAAHGVWTGGEFGLKNKSIMALLVLASFGILIAYPIMIYRIKPDELLIRSLQYTLILFISNSLILLPVVVGALKSENLNEDSRKRFFVAQLGTLIMLGLYLSLAFWAFGIVPEGIKLMEVGKISITFSPVLFLFLVGYFAVVIILPYLTGSIRAKKWRLYLLEKQSTYAGKLLNILDYPNSSDYIMQLEHLKTEAETEIKELPEKDEMIHHGNQIDQDIIDPALSAITPAYKLSRSMDPRFNYLDWLHAFADRVTQITDDIKNTSTDADKMVKAKNWRIPLRGFKSAIDTETEDVKKQNCLLLLQ